MRNRTFFLLMMVTWIFVPFVPTIMAEDTGAPGSLHSYAPFSFWTSMETFLDDPALDEAFESIADAAFDVGKECYEASEIRDFMGEMYAADFSALAVSKGNTFTYYNKNGSIETICNYRYLGTETIEVNGHPAVLHKYERAFCIPWPTKYFNRSIRNPYKYVLVTRVHQDEGSDLIHAHLRYGNTSFDDLMKNPEYGRWRPAIALYGDTTAYRFAEDIIADAPEIAAGLPECHADPAD